MDREDRQEHMNELEREHKLLEMREEPKKPFLSPRMKKEMREWALSLAVALIAVFLIRSFVFTVIRVDGPSMQDTLYTGDRLIVTIADMKLSGANRFDVVICHFPESNERYVKRVIGLPGETLEVKDGVTMIDGEPIEEPFLVDANTVRYHRLNFGPVEIPDGYYFVMGDNRDNSNDSRAVGLISAEKMIGRARIMMWPLNRIGMVAGSDTYQ